MFYDRESSDSAQDSYIRPPLRIHTSTLPLPRPMPMPIPMPNANNANVYALPTHPTPLRLHIHQPSSFICRLSLCSRDGRITRQQSTVHCFYIAYIFHEAIFSKSLRSPRPSISTLDISCSARPQTAFARPIIPLRALCISVL